MAIMSSVGLVTGFFLKHLDSVLKSIASATEIVLTMIASAMLFGTSLNTAGLMAALLVAGGVAMYARPSQPARQSMPSDASEEELKSLTFDDKSQSK